MSGNQNWSHVYRWSPRKKVYPKSLEALQKVIQSAKDEGAKIRVAGSLHSFNDICVTSDIQLHTDNLNKILAINREKMTVRVEAGIKIKTLLEILAKENLTLPDQGYTQKQSIAGALATATHGSGNLKNAGTFCSFIEEIELLDAKAKLHILTPSENPQVFSAAIAHLGCLGITYAVTLRVVPLYRIKYQISRSSYHESLQKLPSLLSNNDRVHLVLNPYNEDALIRTFQNTEEKPYHSFNNSIISFLNKTLMSVFNYIPLPKFMFLHRFKTVRKTMTYVDESYKILSPKDEGRYVEEEIAIPYEHLEQALIDTRNVIQQHAKTNPMLVQFIYIRFVGPDKYGYLSPTLNQGRCYINLTSYVRDGFRELFHEFEKAMMKYQGRPHWGKINTLTKETAQQLYPDTYSKFIEVKQVFDPDGMFSNDYIQRLFNFSPSQKPII